MCKTSSSLPDSYLGLSGSFLMDTSFSERAGCHPMIMSQKKVEDISNWPAPRSMREVQKFIGFANFYH